MIDTRTSDHDEPANRATDASQWVEHVIDAPVVDVYVLVAHPPDTTSFVVDAYETREAAEADRAAVGEDTPVEIVAYTVDLAPAGGRRGRRRGW